MMTTKLKPCLAGLALAGLTLTMLVGASPRPGAASPGRLDAEYGSLPLAFEKNQGQTDRQVKFLARGGGYALFLTGNEAVVSLTSPRGHREAGKRPGPNAAAPKEAVLRMRLTGANPKPKVSGREQLPGTTSYYFGKDPARWRTHVPSFARVEYEGVYPGIDLVYYGKQRQLEYDFVVAPGTDPGQIRMEISGAERAEIAENGDLLLHTPAGALRKHRPVVYQEIEGQRKPVEGEYTLTRKSRRDPKQPFQVAFRLGEYDHRHPLVIDPVLSYASYLGGTGEDVAMSIAVDQWGYAYVTGATKSTNFPTSSARQGPAGKTDVFVCKIDPTGRNFVYSTYLGGSDEDSHVWQEMGIAADADGNAYVTGHTNSTDFPTTAGAYQTTKGIFDDLFVTKLNADGSQLVYSTLIDSGAWDYGQDIEVDPVGRVWITGYTRGNNYPTTANAFDKTMGGGLGDVIVTQLDATGSTILFSSYLGGGGSDYGYGIALGPLGTVYVAGSTDTDDLYVSNGALQTTHAGHADGFIARINPAGSSSTSLVFLTYLGGSAVDNLYGLAVDSNGNAYVTGTTTSDDFPRQNAIRTARAGTWDAFVSKINATGTTLVYSTYHGGGSLGTTGWGIAVNQAGQAYVTGEAWSAGFPLFSPLSGVTGGGWDGYVTQFNAAGNGYVYSVIIGDSTNEGNFFNGGNIALDPVGNAYIVGITGGNNFPVKSAVQSTAGGGGDSFIAKIGNAPLPQPLVAPTNLRLTDATETSLSIAWSDGNADEDGFEVERRTGTNGSFTLVGATGPNVTSLTQTGLPPNTTYQYRVRAVRGGSASGYSTTLTASTESTDAAPRTPTLLDVAVTGAAQLTLTWTDTTSRETGYRVERKTQGGQYVVLQGALPVNTTTYADDSVDPNTTYTYRVTALGATANSDPSNEVSGLTLPAVPSGLSASAGASSIQLTWTQNGGAGGFKLERKVVGGQFAQIATPSGSARSYTDSGLLVGETFYYRLRATNASGDSGYSQVVTVSTGAGLKSLAIKPAKLKSRKKGNGTIQLTDRAPSFGAAVTLTSSDPTALSVPDRVMVKNGKTSAKFKVRAGRVKATTQVTVTATYNGGSKSVTVTVKK